MVTVVFLNEIVSGVGLVPWSGQPLPMVIVIDGNLNAQRYCDDILAHHVIPLFHNNANISIFQHDNATSHTARDTVNLLRTNNIDFIDDWPGNSPDLNPIEHVWDSPTSTNFVKRSFRNGTIFNRHKSTL